MSLSVIYTSFYSSEKLYFKCCFDSKIYLTLYSTIFCFSIHKNKNKKINYLFFLSFFFLLFFLILYCSSHSLLLLFIIILSDSKSFTLFAHLLYCFSHFFTPFTQSFFYQSLFSFSLFSHLNLESICILFILSIVFKLCYFCSPFLPIYVFVSLF